MGSRCYECAEINGYCSCPDRAIYNQQQLDQALATQRADLAEKVRGLDVQASDYESNLISLPEVLAILEVGE